MDVFQLLISFICLSFFIVVVGGIAVTQFLKRRMAVFTEMQQEEMAYQNAPMVDAHYETIEAEPLALSPSHPEPEP